MDHAQQQRLGRRLRRMPGVRTLSRPVERRSGEFDLTYVREGTPGDTPLLIIPGGPGLASVLPYRGIRGAAVRRGFDVAMVEHRGVGLSRTDRTGADLPMAAMTVESVVGDLVAVLDDCGWERAVVYGSSYGGYLAQALGAWHPERVAAMVLDSASSGASGEDLRRRHLRRLFWNGDAPDTAAVASALRSLVADGTVSVADTGLVVPVAYELGGTGLVERLLAAVRRGRPRTWNRIRQLGESEVQRRHPYYMEFDLAGAISYRELGHVRPDGDPMDPHVLFDRQAEGFPEFAGQPVDLPAVLPTCTWPTTVLSGARDTRTVRPVARRTAEALPEGVLVPFENSAHSFLDFHPRVALTAARATANATHRRLPALAARMEGLPRPARSRALPLMLSASVTADRALAAVPVTRPS
ncbi:alpha/beta fold hydrolase [Halostreptopolyspora alba]|uniref:Alpha/beta hydrolase n=1 Tax=Halostreptopolyspora alba TaxID=2487137 RepID=A0A3N0EI67_9ACTN|nr:alpha/beta hydrolase [Nocardiopsaceae bacterium YIM 96095]